MGKTGKVKKRFKMRRGKNLIVQSFIMLPLSAVQSVAGVAVVCFLIQLILSFKNDEDFDGLFGILIGAVVLAAVAIGISVLMVKLKGAEAMDVGWNPNFSYDWNKADNSTLKGVYSVVKNYYKVTPPTSEELSNSERYKLYLIGEISGVDLTIMDENDQIYIMKALSPYKISGGEQYNLSWLTIVWALLSPLALIFQWVAVCAAINQLFSRRIFSCYGEIPFPDVCLKFYFLQMVCHFLFNFVIISNIKEFRWMGSIDEKEKLAEAE